MSRRGWTTLTTGVLDTVAKWVSWVSAILLLLGWLVSLSSWGQHGPFAFIRSRLGLLWGVAVTAGLLFLWFSVARLRGRFSTGFADDFKRDPRLTWGFEGPWQVTPDRELVVTGSDRGGLTKTGALWENYTLTFEARIINRCLGVVVRAQDLDNYYMLQITEHPHRIRPHRRVAVPIILPPPGGEPNPVGGTFQPIGYKVGWQVFEDLSVNVSGDLERWFRVRVSVNGEAIWAYVDDEVVFQHGSFLQIARGKIGFRDDGPEKALVRKVRVKLDG